MVQKPLRFVQRGRILLRCGSAFGVIAALLGRFLPRLGPLVYSSGPFFLRRSFTPQASFRDGPKDQTSDVRLHIGESRDSGFEASPRSQTRQLARRGMTTVSRQTLFCRRLEWPEVAERNGGPRIRQRGQIRPHLREPRAAFAPPLVHVDL